MRKRNMKTFLAAILALALVFSAGLLDMKVYGASLDAEFISITVPDTLTTDQVFQAQITMRNTSDAPWGHHDGQIPAALVSVNPDFNTTWGTYFIIQGQGNIVQPGQTFTFTSWLRAPRQPGTYAFSWRLIHAIPIGGAPIDRSKPLFGDTAAKQITVRQGGAAEPPPAQHREGVLEASDFDYIGSFIPPGVAGHDSTYTDSSLTLRNINGDKHLLLRTGTYNYRLYEIKVPALEKISDQDYSKVKTAQLVRDWGELNCGEINGEEIGANGGMWFDESSGLLYWTHFNFYFCGGPSDFPMLMATRLNADGTQTHTGHWYIPDTPAKYKGYWGGVTKLPQSFAAAYTGGRDLALGFGGTYSICGPASRGPALGAIARPGGSGSTLDLVEMMTYPDPIASVRDGNYLNNVGYWSTPPESLWRGSWTSGDSCPAGVFIDLPDKKGYMAFSAQAIGRIGYDYGGYNSDGSHQNVWYFYDPKDLGAAAQGRIAPHSIAPASFTTVEYPMQSRGTCVTGACFDDQTRTLYVYAKSTIPANYGYKPMIHAYRVRGSGVNPPAPPVNHPPILPDMNGRSVSEGASLSFTIPQASDEDPGQTLIYSASLAPSGNLPAGAAFNTGTRVFTWTPGQHQSGSYTIRFTVSDGEASDYEDVVISVADVPIQTTDAIVADHRHATLNDLRAIPKEAILKAKEELVIVYGHTSHGSQITDGMQGLVGFMARDQDASNDTLYTWNSGGTNGAMALRNTPSGFGTDLGNGSWPTLTRNYLNAHPEVNVVMWSWCGQVSAASEASISSYLDAMSRLEEDYPRVRFVYMTGHLDGTGIHGNLHRRNEQIRAYCQTHNKVLFDFAAIESYDPDGNDYLNKAADDACQYDSDGNGSRDRNWATAWQNSHTANVDWYQCGSAHSQPLNANRKAYAAWYLWARLAGWDGEEDGGSAGGNGGGGGAGGGAGGGNPGGNSDPGTNPDPGTSSDPDEEPPVNHAPVLTAIGPKSVDEGRELRIVASATDADPGTVLIYSAANLPQGSGFNSSTRTFSWTPGQTQSGTYTVRFSVSDGLADDHEDVVMTVQDVATGSGGTGEGGTGTGGGSGGGTGTGSDTGGGSGTGSGTGGGTGSGGNSNNGSGTGGGAGNGSGGGSGFGSGDSAPPSPPISTPTATVHGSQVQIQPVVTGQTALAAITTADTLTALTQAMPDDSGKVTITLQVAKAEGARDYIQQIPASILGSGTRKQQYEICTDVATVTIPGDMFTPADTAHKQNMGISMGLADSSLLKPEVRHKIGDKPVIELKALADGQPVAWKNKTAPVTVSIPYRPSDSELKNPDHIVVWYIDGSGKITLVPSGRYDPASGSVIFTTTHFSTYAVAYEQKTYDDIGHAYARPMIESLASKGFYSWLEGARFNPNRNISRTEFLYLLVMALDLRAEFDTNFSDVAPSDYSYEAVGIARELGITSGIGSNRVGSGLGITRQDMATMLVRALKVASKNYPQGHSEDLKGFSDAGMITPYARDSLAALVKAGILTGYNQILDPAGHFTMQQAAVVIYKIYNRK